MDRMRALEVLGLQDGFDQTEFDLAYNNRQRDLTGRLSMASTHGLRTKYREQLAELESAHRHITGEHGAADPDATVMRDLSAITRTTQQNDETRESMGVAERIGIRQGDLLARRYEVRRRVGVGGMGAVFAAYDRNRNKEIALKVMLPALVSSESARERFMSEGRVASELSHPEIVNVFDVQHEGPYYFLTMELLSGRTLREEMEARKREKRTFSVKEACTVGAALCEALGYAHKYTVHRDVKPENVFLCEDGTLKLMDFGIARLLNPAQLTMTGVSMGTAYYMSPEQLRGSREVDGRTDQYSVGVLIYEMLTGLVPVGMVQPLRSARRDVPGPLAAAITRALSPHPAERLASMDEFAEAFARARHDRGPLIRRVVFGAGLIAAAAAIFVLREPILESLRGQTGMIENVRSRLNSEPEPAPAVQADAAMVQKVTEAGTRVRLLRERIGSMRGEMTGAVAAAEKALAEQEAREKAAMSAVERDVAKVATARMRENLTHTREMLEAGNAEIFSGPTLTVADSKISAGNDAAMAGRHTDALEAFTAAELGLNQLLAMPAAITEAMSRRAQAHTAADSWSAAQKKGLPVDGDLHRRASEAMERGSASVSQRQWQPAAAAYGAAVGYYEELRHKGEQTMLATAKADADKKAAEIEKKAKAEADAKAAKDKAALAALKKPEEAEAEEREQEKASMLGNSFAAIAIEPTDGNRGGGSWKACWRPDAAGAKDCAMESCNRSRSSNRGCVLTAFSSRPGEHCAVARATGYGIAVASCNRARGAAEAIAAADCADAVRTRYGEDRKCTVVWSTATDN